MIQFNKVAVIKCRIIKCVVVYTSNNRLDSTKFCSYTFICKEFQQSTRQEIYPWYNAGRQVQCYAFWKNGSNPYYTIYIQVLLVTISVVKKLVKIVMKCSWHQWQMLVCFFLNERESTSKYLLICVIKF